MVRISNNSVQLKKMKVDCVELAQKADPIGSARIVSCCMSQITHHFAVLPRSQTTVAPHRRTLVEEPEIVVVAR
jgi:hypothetical protein